MNIKSVLLITVCFLVACSGTAQPSKPIHPNPVEPNNMENDEYLEAELELKSDLPVKELSQENGKWFPFLFNVSLGDDTFNSLNVRCAPLKSEFENEKMKAKCIISQVFLFRPNKEKLDKQWEKNKPIYMGNEFQTNLCNSYREPDKTKQDAFSLPRSSSISKTDKLFIKAIEEGCNQNKWNSFMHYMQLQHQRDSVTCKLDHSMPLEYIFEQTEDNTWVANSTPDAKSECQATLKITLFRLKKGRMAGRWAFHQVREVPPNRADIPGCLGSTATTYSPIYSDLRTRSLPCRYVQW
jgi:hypothetical protein